MENQDADQADVANAVTVDLHSPDRKVSRRRFVQSTLFPLKPHESKIESSGGKKEVKLNEEIDGDNDDNNGDGDECCGSQKRKRGRKPKLNSTPQKKSSKKVANGEDSPTMAVADIESSDCGSPQQLKRKQRVSTRNGRTSGCKRASPAKLPTHSSATHQASQPVPDLRLEAKKTAEENSRLFAGKQLHPFFSMWKVGKKDVETTEVEGNGCLDDKKEKNAQLGPIHVFENVKDDFDSTDWSKWTFYDGTFGTASYNHEWMDCTLNSPVLSVNSDTAGVLNPWGLPLLLDDFPPSLCSGAHQDSSVIPNSFNRLVVSEEVTPDNLLKNIEKDFEVGKLDFITNNIGNSISDFEHRNAILLERIMSYYLSRHTHPENSLWTSKYQPEKALEVCGNSEAVKFINEWLRLWYSTKFNVTKKLSGANSGLIDEDEYDPYDGESDAENAHEASGLKNVLLVKGPVGSGKSAAIYACAKEQGFQVVEVNASDWRNGALLKQKFGEAVVSHHVKRSQESPVLSQNKLSLMSSPAPLANGIAPLDLNCEVVEETSLLDEGNSSAGAGDQSEIKTLILFEDIDATLCEDRGFVSTIQQLAETGKRPMILTTSSKGESPVLPDNLDREEVGFTMPSFKELVHHIYMICASEKVSLRPHLIERCVQLCRGDIRKSLMFLQFWCQSQRCSQDGKKQSTCSPLMFNLDAGHCTLPKLIPWELPSSLSESIETEISKSLYMIKMEENHDLWEAAEEEMRNTNTEHTYVPFEGETANVDARKEEILRGNCFLPVDNDFMAIRNLCELSNSTDSPVAFNRRNHRRKRDTVLSDSEDDFDNNGNSAVAEGLCDDGNNTGGAVPALNSNFLSAYSAAVDTSCHPVNTSGAVNVELSLNQVSFSAVGDLCDQAIDPLDHYTDIRSAKNPHQLPQAIDVNQSNTVACSDSLKPLSDLILNFGEKEMEIDNNQFPAPACSHNFSTTFDAVKTEAGNENHCSQETAHNGLNPLSVQLEHNTETKVSVKRCLFSQTPSSDPVSCAGVGICNQSTDQLIRCEDSSWRELQQNHLEAEIANPKIKEAIDGSLNPLFDQLPCHERANGGNMDHQHVEVADTMPSNHPAIEVLLHLSTGSRFIEVEGEKEIKCQFSEARDTNDTSAAAISDSFNQSSGQLIGMAGQKQHPGNGEDNLLSFSPMGDSSLKQLSGQSCFEVRNSETVKRQSPGIAYVDVVRSPRLGDSKSPVNGNVEEHQSEFSVATKGNHHVPSHYCQSIDISCVPESTFVPETEINDGKDLPSGTDVVEFVSPVATDTFDSCFIRNKTPEHIQYTSDVNLNVRYETGDDSQSEDEHIEASTSGCQVMDECSRMDFLKRSNISRLAAAKNPVQERWDELRKTDMRHHSAMENENACEVLELTYGISNLISEADLLFHNGKLQINDCIDEDAELDEETLPFGWHDQQVQMASATAHHGFCLFCKDIDTLQSKMGVENRMHLAWEMLASTNNSMALGKLLRLNSLTERSLMGDANALYNFSKRERETQLHNIVTSTVPTRCHLALRGYAFHDYLSSLAHISKSESSRMAEASGKTKRARVRIAKNYLSSGGLDLAPEDISVLKEYYYGLKKAQSESTCGI